MGFFKKIFGGADGIRETMRESYEKHRQAAPRGEDTFPPHEFGLFGALGTRYMSRRESPAEMVVWAELAPFLLMDEAEAVEVLAEYAVYRESVNDSRFDWLSDRINAAFERLPSALEHHQMLAGAGLIEAPLSAPRTLRPTPEDA